MQFELAVQDPTGIRIAADIGADRTEVCSALALGGLTPSLGLIELAAASGVPAHVLLRPRAGGFEYTAAEADLIAVDARAALAAGAAGIVVGATRGGDIDRDFVDRMRSIAGRAELTFHRAFDAIRDQAAALEVLIDAGVDRVLTSGGASRAIDATDELVSLVARAAGRIQIMAGSGVTPENAAAIVRTGVDAVHASASRHVSETLAVSLGVSAGEGAGYHTTCPEAAARIRAVVPA